MKQYKDSATEIDKNDFKVKTTWNTIQSKVRLLGYPALLQILKITSQLKCCGVNNADDWSGGNFGLTGGFLVPEGCCHWSRNGMNPNKWEAMFPKEHHTTLASPNQNNISTPSSSPKNNKGTSKELPTLSIPRKGSVSVSKKQGHRSKPWPTFFFSSSVDNFEPYQTIWKKKTNYDC